MKCSGVEAPAALEAIEGVDTGHGLSHKNVDGEGRTSLPLLC